MKQSDLDYFARVLKNLSEEFSRECVNDTSLEPRKWQNAMNHMTVARMVIQEIRGE